MRLHPFRALRPRPELAARVASVPYDVVDRDEAAELAAGEPLSFLHVVRAEIDLPPDQDPYAPEVYAKARSNLERLRREGVLRLDERPSFLVYRLATGDHVQTGVVGCVHIDDYESGIVKKHEKTRPAKENDRTRHILELEADPEPVLLTYRGVAEVDRLVQEIVATAPVYDFRATDGVRHTVWSVAETGSLAAAFAAVPECYVADGHHRCAAAWRAGGELRAEDVHHGGDEEYQWFPAVLFPAAQMRILPYHRVLAGRDGLTPREVLARLADVGTVSPSDEPQPDHPATFGVYLGGGSWHRLELDPATVDADDPIRSLDAELLQTRVLEPIFGIEDPRTDPRIDFVGGSRGTGELERRVDGGRAAMAIAMRATTVEQLMRVADAGQVMPPKSTWFEPKLRSGLFLHLLAEPE